MKRTVLIILATALTLTLSACSAKLTTVRPAEISELRIERISDGITVTLPTDKNDAELKNLLIFQLEEPYEKIGACTESDEHLYNVSLYIGDKLDTSVILNSNGYVCKKGKRYVCSDKADKPVDINQWSALFDE